MEHLGAAIDIISANNAVKECQYCEHSVWISDPHDNREIRCRVDNETGWPVCALTDTCEKFEQSKDVLKQPPESL